MTKTIAVALIIGSKSDLDFMQPGFNTLDKLGISWEKTVLSAHRQADKLKEYVEDAAKRGVKIFIAAAGLSAALPGAVASLTTLPVVGVPVPGGTLKGLDALLAIVQMPSGVPVAAVGLGSQGPKNAAVLAAEILALNDQELSLRLVGYKEELKRG